MSPSSEVLMYYRCTSCCECFFTLSKFLDHAERVHCKVLVCQGHDPEENTNSVDSVQPESVPSKYEHVVEAAAVQRAGANWEAARVQPEASATSSWPSEEVPLVNVKVEAMDEIDNAATSVDESLATTIFFNDHLQVPGSVSDDILCSVRAETDFYPSLSDTGVTNEDIFNMHGIPLEMQYGGIAVDENMAQHARRRDHQPNDAHIARQVQHSEREKTGCIIPAVTKRAPGTTLGSAPHAVVKLRNRPRATNTLDLGCGARRNFGASQSSLPTVQRASTSSNIAAPGHSIGEQQQQQQHQQHQQQQQQQQQQQLAAQRVPCNKASGRSKTCLNAQCFVHAREKRYPCIVCSSAFSFPSALKSHLRSHRGEKPYKCEWCDAAFAKSSNLITHRRMHTGERPYHCGICGENFTRSTLLKRHQRKH